jgi:hypothetical protein
MAIHCFQYPIIPLSSLLCQYYTQFFYKILGRIAHNVPAVGDVLPARIRALRSKDQGWQNVGGVWRGNEAKRNDLAIRNPEPL